MRSTFDVTLRIRDTLIGDETREIVRHASEPTGMRFPGSRGVLIAVTDEAVFPHGDADDVGTVLGRIIGPVGRTAVTAADVARDSVVRRDVLVGPHETSRRTSGDLTPGPIHICRATRGTAEKPAHRIAVVVA